MAKSKEELNKIKEEVKTVNEKLHELTPDELEQVTGGWIAAIADAKFASMAEGKSGEIIHKIKGEIRQLGSIDNGSFSSQDL